MSEPNVREEYRLKISPNGNPDAVSKRVAEYIINRWLPNNAGGVHVLLTPRLSSSIFEIINGKMSVLIDIDTRKTTPVITEVV